MSKYKILILLLRNGGVAVSLYSFKLSDLGEIHRKAIVLPGNNIMHSHKEAPRRIHFSGGLTVEATIILPLLAYFFVCILFFFRIMQVQIVIQDAINCTGRKMALCQNENIEADTVIAKGLFIGEVKDTALIEKYVEGGMWGVSFVESQFDEEQIHINVKYRISLPIRLFWSVEFDMQQRADCRRWNGWHYGADDEVSDVWVYVTETGEVYHMAETCSHLTLSIRSVNKEQLSYLRNENGESYQKCSRCEDESSLGGNVYITNQGDCYHTNLNCSGIRRTVYMIRKSDVEHLRCCSRCGNFDMAR